MYNALKVIGYLIVFLIINLIFAFFFPPVLTPEGEIGSIKPLNLLFSIVYIVCWAFVAALAGIKKNKNILSAVIILTMIPYLGLSLDFLRIKFGIYLVLFIFLWNSISQGFSHDISGIFIFIYIYFPALMMVTFVLVYFASLPLFKILGTRFKDKDF